jgi:hypothetical protein
MEARKFASKGSGGSLRISERSKGGSPPIYGRERRPSGLAAIAAPIPRAFSADFTRLSKTLFTQVIKGDSHIGQRMRRNKKFRDLAKRIQAAQRVKDPDDYRAHVDYSWNNPVPGL